MNKFAFFVFPFLDNLDRFAFGRIFGQEVAGGMMRLLPPRKIAHLTGNKNSFQKIEGWLIFCPLTLSQIFTGSEEYVGGRLVRAGRLAKKLGAEIMGLGSYFSSATYNAAAMITDNLGVAVTTGFKYTVAAALEGVKEAIRLMSRDIKKTRAAILGAASLPGALFALLLAREVGALILQAKDKKILERLQGKVLYQTGLAAKITEDLKQALAGAQLVVIDSNAVEMMIDPADLMPGAVLCDFLPPYKVSRQVAGKRKDILIIEGSLIRMPAGTGFGFPAGFPEGTVRADLAETMLLALEGRSENLPPGKDLKVAQVTELSQLARKHGFRTAGLHFCGRTIDSAMIGKIKQHTRSITLRGKES